MKQYNGEKYIVSFTSFGPRIEHATKMIYSMLQQTYKDFHLVMTLYKDDVKYISNNMQLLLDNDVLELIIADIDLGPHCKYYYAMKKYYDKPIITVDDDRRYASDTLAKLITKFESVNYKTIISNCAIKMQKTNRGILPYSNWCPFRLKPHEKSYLAMAEGFAGILYPPKCFDNLLSSEWVNCISDCKYDDDLYLKIQGIKNKIPVTQSTHIQGCAEIDNIKESMPYNLHNNQNKGDTPRNNLCYKHAAELLKGWEL